MTNNMRPLFGAHMSIAGGLHEAVRRGVDAGCDIIQLFSHNQRQWKIPPLEPADTETFRSAMTHSNLHGGVAHASYLINLAASDPALYKRSIEALRTELHRAQALGLLGVIVHPGSPRNKDRDTGICRIVQALKQLKQEVEPRGPGRLFIENAAGQGQTLGVELEEWFRIVDQADAPGQIEWCLDTCHLFAAGVHIDKIEGYVHLMDFIEARGMIEAIPALHVNDSKRACGSRIDRHEHIGKGEIGETFFRNLCKDSRWSGHWMILETPKDKAGQWDKMNLATLRGFLSE